MKVLHVLNHSVPHLDGYCVRTLNILRHQARSGIEVIPLTSPHHESANSLSQEQVEGFEFYRTLGDGLSTLPAMHELHAISRCKRRLEEVAAQTQPDVLHSHSPCLWGLATSRVARRLGIPFVYEIRGIWEDASVDLGRIKSTSMKYRASRRLETHVARRADAVVAISDGLVDEFKSRGVCADRIWKACNGVDVDSFTPVKRDWEFSQQLGLADKRVVAYIGSLYPWEGVDDLIRSFGQVVSELDNAVLLIVGGGEIEGMLREVADQSQLGDAIQFTGRVPHDDIIKYYSIADLLVYPRKKTRNVELVTPLKPLEAMALGKAILGSDVGGIRELLPDDDRCLYPSGDNRALADRIVAILKDEPLQHQIGDSMRDYVVNHKRWESIVQTYHDVYNSLLGK